MHAASGEPEHFGWSSASGLLFRPGSGEAGSPVHCNPPPGGRRRVVACAAGGFSDRHFTVDTWGACVSSCEDNLFSALVSAIGGVRKLRVTAPGVGLLAGGVRN